MDENEVLTPVERASNDEEISTPTPARNEETDATPDAPDFDPEEWERKRQEEWEAKIVPFRNLRTQINEHDELMAETLYEVTLLELGEMEV